MKLRKKSIVIITTAYVITSLTLFLTCGTIIMGSFKGLEDRELTLNVNRIKGAINYDIASLSFKSKDYASWDSTYNFIESRSEEYIRSEMSDDTFSNLQMNLIAMLDNKLNLVFTKNFDIDNQKEIPISNGESDFLNKIRTSSILRSTNEKDGIKGVVLIDNTPMLVSIRYILDSDSKGPSRGYMVTGRFLDGKEMSDITEIINTDFQITPVTSSGKGIPDKLSKKEIDSLGSGSTLIKSLSSTAIAGYVLQKDIYGNPAIIVKVPMERYIMIQGRTSMKYLVIILFTIGFVFLSVAVILQDRLVLKRVLKLNKEVNEIGVKENFSMRVEVRGNDEISNLSGSVNSMLMTLESSFNRLKDSNEKLKELDELKNEFISTVSHELRTPLTSILGFAKLIKKKVNKSILPATDMKDEKLNKAVEQILSNSEIIISEGERLTQIVNNVLDISKIEAGKIDWKQEEVSIEEVIDKSYAATAALIRGKKLKWTKDIQEELPVVMGDKEKLIQVVINLISNAVKFTDEGSITCSAYVNGRELITSLSDTGMGIDEKHKTTIFEKFKQLEDNRLNKPAGTGLGLPICKNIIEHHGGRIWVEGCLNRGTTFLFSLPINKN